MARRLKYSDNAQADIESISEYISDAAQNAEAGTRFADRLIARCEHIASLPGMMGRPRPELRQDLRSLAFGNYVIFFRYRDEVLEIVNVLEGHRDMDAQFDADS